MVTTPDAAAIRRLNEALEAHRGDDKAYKRLGAQLRDRRPLLDRRFGNRSLFARERLVPLGMSVSAAYKLAAELETGFGQDRHGTSMGTMLTAAEAYEVSPDEIVTVLDGGDFGEVARGRPLSAAVGWLPPLPADQSADARPFADAIYADLRRWTAKYAREHPDVPLEGIPDPAGAELFGPGTPDAATWDVRADLMTVQERVWLIATLRARQARARRSDTSVG